MCCTPISSCLGSIGSTGSTHSSIWCRAAGACAAKGACGISNSSAISCGRHIEGAASDAEPVDAAAAGCQQGRGLRWCSLLLLLLLF
jgi:hypothetical protein